MTYERSWLTRSTYLQTTRMYALPPFCGSQLAENGRLLVSVTDAGVGLPNGKTDQVFNAFFTTKPQGTGLGQAIARSIVESHGGRIWATANAGRGVKFYFTLPSTVAATG